MCTYYGVCTALAKRCIVASRCHLFPFFQCLLFSMVAHDDQVGFHRLASQTFLAASLPVYLITRYVIVAPFGRHAAAQDHRWWFGPKFNARMSWFVFESPNLFWCWYCYARLLDPGTFFLDPSEAAIVSWEEDGLLRVSTNAILLSLFALHYINRTIVYPLLMSSESQPVPLVVIAAGFVTTFVNGYLQCLYLVRVHKFEPLAVSSLSFDDIQIWAGISLFLTGMGINIHSDGVLRNLRKNRRPDRRRRAYYIPRSPCFKYVSCPNLAGEMLEWFGYALSSQFSLPSVAFLLYTACNLIPRGLSHHQWYLQKFDDYPTERKWALIPFIV